MTMKDYPISEKQLGAIYEPHQTTFNVWAPAHKHVSLAIYESAKSPFRELFPMHPDQDGVFSIIMQGDYHGKYYTYILDHSAEVTDPYCLSSSSNSLRSAVVDLERTHPDNWKDHSRPTGALGCDAILYEVHVCDFSASNSSGMTHKGKYLAFTEEGTTYNDVATGLDHLVDLGITHVHLMPVYDYITVDEELDDDKNYNWGYDPEHYNSPEGSYSLDPNDPTSRIRELKAAIMALHEKGIKVVLDVVYNHTYRSEASNFNTLAPNYYHRTTEDGIFSNGSGCGNEFASEKPMARKFIVDSLKYWATEFKVDGFRFDLMALIDIETIEIARKELLSIDPEILIYGEPWMGGLSVLPEDKRIYKGVQCNKGFALFNDDFRDAIKGDNDGWGTGFVQGNKDTKHKMHVGIVGSVPYSTEYIGFASHPCESINYFNSHDNLILYDKIKASMPNASHEMLIKLNKLCFSILMTSQGVPFFHAGNEFLRDKKGVHNSYNSPISINAIDWQKKANHLEYYQFVKDLIRLRKDYPCFRMKTVEDIRKRIHFIEFGSFEEAYKAGIVYIIRTCKDDCAKDSYSNSETAAYRQNYDCLLVVHNPSHDPMLLSVAMLQEALHSFCEEEHSSKTTKSKKSKTFEIELDLIFDDSGYKYPPIDLEPATHHLLRVAPMSSSVFGITKK